MLRFLSRLHRAVGAQSVRAFHLNDTRALLGSRRESHVPWGRGFLGGEGLRVLLARPEYADRPAIVELPLPADRAAALASLTFVRGLRP
jgi:endonuclease IV